MSKEEVLQNCVVEGQVVKLPSVELDRKEYLAVKKSLELIGGKWKGGKISGFVFQTDPQNRGHSSCENSREYYKRSLCVHPVQPG